MNKLLSTPTASLLLYSVKLSICTAVCFSKKRISGLHAVGWFVLSFVDIIIPQSLHMENTNQTTLKPV